jgi:hypothetical protein
MRFALAAITALTLFSLIAKADDIPATTQPTTKTGAFEIIFTDRSPDSDYSKLIARTGATKDELGPDYDLAKEPFAAYVPPDYDGKKPFGLIVQSFQDGGSEIFQPYRSVLDAHHLMVFATEKDHLPFAENTGVCIDAVYNLRKMYNVDPARTYLFGLSKYIEPVGMCTPDYFRGGAYMWWYDYFRGVPGNPPMVKYNPPTSLLDLAHQRVQILAFYPNASQWYQTALVNQLKNDGFEHVFSTSAGHDEVFQPQWFEKIVSMLESVKPLRPATAPAVDEPAQLLRVAQAYISGGLPDRARDKLNLILQKYPNDPAAIKAKELLDQLNSQ